MLSNLVVGIAFSIIAARKLCASCSPLSMSELQVNGIGWNSAVEESLFLPERERLAQRAVGVRIATCRKKEHFDALCLCTLNSPGKLRMHMKILMHKIHHFLDFILREMHSLPRLESYLQN